MAKKLKLPKRIAGIKIPKVIRKGPVRDFMNSQAGQLIIAQSLVAAAGVFTTAKATGADAGDVVKHPGDAAKAAVSLGEDQAARLTFALKEAARAFRQAMEQGPSAGEAWNTAQAEQPESGSKKKAVAPARTVPGSALAHIPAKPIATRLGHAFQRWLMRRLQRRLEREWGRYKHSPRVSIGPFIPAAARDGTHVYRSLVQIHFHSAKT